MNFEFARETVHCNELIIEEVLEQPLDCDITLPDYCSDILKILKCYVCPRITSEKVSAKRASAEGSSLIRIVYEDSNNNISAYEQCVPFTKNMDSELITECTNVFVSAKLSYVNCRVASQRRLDIHGALSVIFKAYSNTSKELITSILGEDIQQKKKTIKYSDCKTYLNRYFTSTSVLTINDDKPQVSKIIRTNSYFSINETKIIKDKVLIKGVLAVNIIYSTDEVSGELCSFDNEIPVTQIIEAPGIIPEANTNISVFVSGIDVIQKTDSNGNYRLLDISCTLNAISKCDEIKDIDIVTDAYSTKYNINLQKNNLISRIVKEEISEKYLSKNSISLSEYNITNIVDIWCDSNSFEEKIDNNQLTIKGSILVGIIAKNADSSIDYIERTIEYGFEHYMENSNNQKSMSDITICGWSYVFTSEQSIEMRIEMDVKSAVYADMSEQIVFGIDDTEDNEKIYKTSALWVYYSQGNESVWDIARRYSTTVSAVMEENNLSDEMITDRMMLLIPGT